MEMRPNPFLYAWRGGGSRGHAGKRRRAIEGWPGEEGVVRLCSGE
jgi:hypothetical protein